MSDDFILPQEPEPKHIKPYVVVCEGMGDAKFIDRLLKDLKIANCCVGCPNPKFTKGQGVEKIPEYLAGIYTINKGRNLISGIAVITDANNSFQKRFNMVTKGLKDAQFPKPRSAYSVLNTHGQPRVGVYLIPRKGQKGVLEDLLLEAVFKKRPALQRCVDLFSSCTGATKWKKNARAKQKLSALVSVTCRKNPWASSNTMWGDKGCPVPIDSPCFKEIKDFLTEFTKP